MPGNFRRLAARDARDLPLFSYAARGVYESLDRLDQRYFTATLLAALALHAAALVAWHLMPKTEVIEVPVRALNIKLGDGEIMMTPETAVPNTANKAGVEIAISRLVRDMNAEKQPAAKAIDKAIASPAKTPSKAAKATKSDRKFDLRREKPNIAAPVVPVVARQFVRDLSPPVPIAKSSERVTSAGSPAGNSKASDAEMIARYEQLISLWIQKFKLYPEEARKQSMQGETVVRIRIDRRGNIRYYLLDRSTGHEMLDRAAIDMIRRANPVPAAPSEYPPGELLEFLIPVHFQLQ